jgi:hypothetical protein
MTGKIAAGAVVAIALVIAPVRLPAASCILSNSPSEKACMPGCCANKTCCKSSQKNTSPPVQPLVKAGSGLQNIVNLPSTAVVLMLPQTAANQPPVFSSAEWTAHSPAPLALICIRLI